MCELTLTPETWFPPSSCVWIRNQHRVKYGSIKQYTMNIYIYIYIYIWIIYIYIYICILNEYIWSYIQDIYIYITFSSRTYCESGQHMSFTNSTVILIKGHNRSSVNDLKSWEQAVCRAGSAEGLHGALAFLKTTPHF